MDSGSVIELVINHIYFSFLLCLVFFHSFLAFYSLEQCIQVEQIAEKMVSFIAQGEHKKKKIIIEVEFFTLLKVTLRKRQLWLFCVCKLLRVFMSERQREYVYA